MSHILNAIEENLTAKEIKFDLRFDAEQNRHLFYLNFGGTNGHFTLVWSIFHEYSQMMLLGILPVKVPQARRHDLILLLNSLNYALKLGNFELDENDGEIRFRYGFYFDADLPFSERLIMDSLAIPFLTIDQKIPEIMKAIYATKNDPILTPSVLPFWCN